MDSVLSFIRAEISRGASPGPKGAEAFRAYAIASTKGLIPEMENAARQTLEYPMTFEVIGEGLRLFEGWALCDLVDFRRRCRDNLVTCLDTFLQVRPPWSSSIWVGCPEVMNNVLSECGTYYRRIPTLPRWLHQLISLSQSDLKLQKLTEPLNIRSRIRGEYFKALRTHLNCKFCMGLHTEVGFGFCDDLENKLAEAVNKSSRFDSSRS